MTWPQRLKIKRVLHPNYYAAAALSLRSLTASSNSLYILSSSYWVSSERGSGL